MSEKKVDNPFAGFDLLNGGLGKVDSNDTDEVEDDVVAGDQTIIEDEIKPSELGANEKAAEEALKKVIEKQSKSKEDKSKTEIVEDELTEEEDNDEEDKGVGFKPALSHLADKGILEFDDSQIEDSEEGFEKAIDQTINKRFEKLLHNKLGEDGLALLSFVENGGNPKHFIEAYYNDSSWEDYKIDENEAAQKIAVRESLRLAGEEAEDIEDMITEFTDNGTLEKRAKSALTKLQKFETSHKKDLIEYQKNKAEQDKQSEQKYWNDFKTDLMSREEIKGFKLTPKLKEKVWDHLSKIDKKTGKTNYQLKMESDSEASLLFALQSALDFDISKLEKQVVTKVASKLNGLMNNYQKSTKDKISTGRSDINTDGVDPFAGFKKMQ